MFGTIDLYPLLFLKLVLRAQNYTDSAYFVFIAALVTYLVHSLAELMLFFKRAFRCRLAGELFTVDDLLHSSATGLFKKMRHSTHCLNHLLPPIKLWIMFCVTVANPTSCHSATTSLIRTRLLIGVCSTRF